MDIKPILEQLNLDTKEIAVYIATLELGETNVLPIVRKVNFPRNTTVYTLERLQEKGLIDIIERNNRRVYLPKPPSELVSLIKQQKNQLEKQLVTLQESLPEINRLYAAPHFQPRVKIYRGQTEIRQIYEDMLESSASEILYVGEYDKIAEILGIRYLKLWIKRRIAKKITTRSIRVKSTEINEPIFQLPQETLREIKYAPHGFESPGHVVIYGDRVAVITTSKENFGVMTISPEYSQIMRNWFAVLWNTSKKFN